MFGFFAAIVLLSCFETSDHVYDLGRRDARLPRSGFEGKARDEDRVSRNAQSTRRSFWIDFATALETLVMNSCAEAGLKVWLTPDQISLSLGSE